MQNVQNEIIEVQATEIETVETVKPANPYAIDKSTLPAALLQRGASPRMSNLYQNICTADVIDVMESNGFNVHDWKVDKAYKRADEADFGRHMVIFRQNGIEKQPGESVPQMLWINSHNGKTPAVMRYGVYRFICSNGMVVGDDLLSVRVRHMGPLASQIVQQIELFHQHTGAIENKIEQWKQIELTRPQMLDFANRALTLRFGEEKAKQYDPLEFITPKRAEDDAGNLWAVFNRAQESGTKGGTAGKNANNRNVRSKALTAIGLDIEFNKQLWTLADQFAVNPPRIIVPATLGPVDIGDTSMVELAVLTRGAVSFAE